MSNNQNLTIDMTGSHDGKYTVKRKASHKLTDEITTQKSSKSNSIGISNKQVSSHSQRKAVKKYSSSRRHSAEGDKTEDHYTTPKMRATTKPSGRPGSVNLKSSIRSQQIVHRYRDETEIDNTPEKEERIIVDKIAKINKEVTRPMESCNDTNEDEDSGMEFSAEFDSGPENITKLVTPKSKPINANTRRATRRSVEKRSDVNHHTNSPECFSSDYETENIPRSKHSRKNRKNITKKSGDTFVVNDAAPLSESYFVTSPEEEVEATPESRQAKVKTHRISQRASEICVANGDESLSESSSLPQSRRGEQAKTSKVARKIAECHSESASSLLIDYDSPPEKRAHRSLSHRRERMWPRSKSRDDCCCGDTYIDSHNVLSIMNSDLACSYHRCLGRALSGYLLQVMYVCMKKFWFGGKVLF